MTLSHLPERDKMAGQINLGSIAGDMIYQLCLRQDVNNIVEFGTWNGLGSTQCVIKALKDSLSPKHFTSIELYEDFYQLAKSNLKEDLKYVNLLNGTIITNADMDWFDHSATLSSIHYGDFNDVQTAHATLWYAKDLSRLSTAKMLISQIPSQIDLLILDGGEYTTYPEWLKLKDRTKIFVLDDTKFLKCRKIRQEMLNNADYTVLHDDLNDRNGFSVFIHNHL